MRWLALDIGGANLKSADGRGFADSQSFSLWSKPQQLTEALRTMIAGAPPADHLAVTMTGELADCFATRSAGVLAILDAVEQAADHRHTRVYLSTGMLVSIPVARRHPLAAAASNWHALGRFAARYFTGGTGIVLDVGSTTTDLIPVTGGQPPTSSAERIHDDAARLIAGELFYTGVMRSPVCAVVTALPYRGQSCPVAQEVFATTWDAYLTLGELPEDALSTHTADRQPATADAARNRLARCVCADRDSFTAEDAMAAAQAIVTAQTSKIGIALANVLRQLPQPPENVVISGGGECLARRVLQRGKLATLPVVSLGEQLGPMVSRCAPAHALAVLAQAESPA